MLDEETEFDRAPAVSIEDVIYEAKQTAKQMERRSLMGAVPLVVALGAMVTSTLTLRQTAFMDPRHQVGEWGIGAVRPVWSAQQASPTLILTIREKSHQQGMELQ